MKYTSIRRKLSDAEIIALYQSGVDSCTVAIQAGCCDTTVRDIVRAAGGAIRPPGRKPRRALRIPDDEIARLYKSGMGAPEIADRAGCAANTVYKILRDGGVAVRASFEKAKADRQKRRNRP